MVSIPLPSFRWTPALLALVFPFAIRVDAQERFIRGDTNQDGSVDVSDAVTTIGHLFLGLAPLLDCADAADLNDDGVLDITDPIGLLSFLFQAGPPPLPPFPGCGFDRAEEGETLRCEKSGGCPPTCRHPSLPGLCRLETNGDLLCPGERVTLVGINFSRDAGKNQVRFRGAGGVVRGVPLAVSFPADRDPADGIDSRLEVLVPTGLESGTLELVVDRVPAGDVEYEACPALFGSGIGPSAHEPRLVHSWVAGFLPPFTVNLFGLNLKNATEAILSDRFGVEVRIPRERFLRSTLPGLPQNGLEYVQLTVAGLSGLSIHESSDVFRDNLTVEVANGGRRSNKVQIPVGIYPAAKGLGAVLNGIAVPSGVRTGPVRIHYSIYDHPEINQGYAINLEWTADGGENWFPALPDRNDPLHDGERQVLPGDIDFGPPAGLFFAGGALKTFVWDAPKDPSFNALMDATGGLGALSQALEIRFRIHPVPDNVADGKPGDSGHYIDSPPVAYLGRIGSLAGEASVERGGELLEDFTTRDGFDPTCTTALWGPPASPGQLRGSLPAGPAALFGNGTFDLILEPLEPPPPGLRAQFYLVNTSRMRIDRVIDAGEGIDVAQVFPSGAHPNPGQDLFEFHVRTLTVEKSIEVRFEGSRPAVFRVSGEGMSPAEESVRIEGTLEASGDPGLTDGTGGRSRAGNGEGGRGAKLQLDGSGQVTRLSQFQPGLTPAEAGGNDGGGGGATAAAVDPAFGALSRFRGAPGGGGGHLTEGVAGDAGAPKNPAFFPPPRGGYGGPQRGNIQLVPLTEGSGGGGGGATINRPASSFTATAVPGAGGGGGGGAIQITAHGSIEIARAIRVNGGKGGDGSDSGAGGGGSGGSILLQSSGFIRVGCENLEASGGNRGTFTGASVGSGDGAPGRIRVEPALGGVPVCQRLAAQTELTARLDTSLAVSKLIAVKDASEFPLSGVVRIEEELIAYERRTDTSLQNLTRGLRGTMVANHEGPPSPTSVVLLTAVRPPEGLVEEGGEILESPEPIAAGAGPDGTFQAEFIGAIDPGTSKPLTDPESGEPISPWTVDTDRGTITRPDGAVALVSASSASDPGLFAFESLRIEAGVVLRAFGSRPLRIRVRGTAEIAGTIELSGQEGGPLAFSAEAPSLPGPGGGGIPGAGGGKGGQGASVKFKDGDPENKLPANLELEPAAHGGLPAGFPARFDRTGSTSGAVPPPVDLSGIETTRATRGDSLIERDGGCEVAETRCTAGGGGGGGARFPGADGGARPEGSKLFGRGGSRLGVDSFRFENAFLLLGGEGGSGGGASAEVSEDYRSGNAGDSLFKAAARLAPGTGGGGGGGALHLVVEGALLLRSSGAIVARGGDSRQSIDLGGNGGAGAGGSLLIQVANALDIERGARIDVRGGRANLPPPVPMGQFLPLYEGNIRSSGPEPGRWSGTGGNGATGRVRIEAPAGSGLFKAGFNDSLSSAGFLPGAYWSTGCSKVIPLEAGPGGGARSHLWRLERPLVGFAPAGLPEGTEAVILWKAFAPSLDLHGAPGVLRGEVEDPRDLQDLEFIRFEVRLRSNGVSGATPSIEEIRLPLGLGE